MRAFKHLPTRPLLLTAAAMIVLGGCAALPDPIAGERYQETPYPAQVGESSLGADVRWGGSIVETRPLSDHTCIEILAQPLSGSGYPRASDEDLGRFLACRDEFIDPEIFVGDRAVTVVGTLDAFTTGKVGEFEYRYPRVAADAVYLWPERVYEDRYYGYGYHYPYFWPYYSYPYYNFGYGVGFYRPYYHGRLHESGGSAPDTKPDSN